MRRRAAIQYALIVAFFIVPVAFLTFGPRYVPLGIDVYIALLVISILMAVPATVFFVLALVMNVRRSRRSVGIDYMRREYMYTAWAALFVTITLTGALATSFTPIAPVYAALVLAYALLVISSPARRHDFRVAIVVRCAPSEAFEFVSDPRNTHRYFPQADVVGPIDLPLHVGSTVRYRVHEKGRILEGDETVIDVLPNRRFSTQTADMSQGTYVVTPVDGATEIAYEYASVIPIPRAVLGGTIGFRAFRELMISRRMEGMRRLKDILEARPPVSV